MRVLAKVYGRYCVQETIGCGRDESRLREFERKAGQWTTIRLIGTCDSLDTRDTHQPYAVRRQDQEEYGYLFMIDRAFRFCKTDLDIRPMYTTESSGSRRLNASASLLIPSCSNCSGS